jgi:hypothetical protein
MDWRGRVGVAIALVLGGGADAAAAADRCKVKVDKKSGVIEFSASDVDGETLRWGDTTTNQPYAFHDPACVKGDKAVKCTLGSRDSNEAKTPPRYCTIYALDSRGGCIVWVPGCTPGMREPELFGGQIGGEDITDGSIGPAELVLGSIGAAQIANGAVGPAQLAFGAVGADEIDDGSIGPDDLAEHSIGPDQLAPQSIGPDQLAPDAVRSAHIQTQAVGASEIADGAVGMAEVELPAGSALNGDLVLDRGDNYLFGSGPAFTPPASGRCLVTVDAWIYTGDGDNADVAWLQTAREEDGNRQTRDTLEGPLFPAIADKSTGNATTTFVWTVTAGRPTRFGCFVFVDDASFEGDTLSCRASWLCQ